MKNKKIILITLIVIVSITIGVLCYLTYFKSDKPEENKTIKTIEKYGYTLNNYSTDLYKIEFNTLNDILTKETVDYDEYAKQISKLFIIDFYTLENKLSKNDIGGTEFIKPDIKDNFIEKSRSTFYKYLEVKETRVQDLPVVSAIISAEVSKTTFEYKDGTKDEEAYKVTISWEYEVDLGYETKKELTLVKENNKLYIIEVK